jgi:hypothetical protein
MPREEVVSIRGWLEHHHNPDNDARLARLKELELKHGPDDGVVYDFDGDDIPLNIVPDGDPEYAAVIEEMLNDALGG